MGFSGWATTCGACLVLAALASLLPQEVAAFWGQEGCMFYYGLQQGEEDMVGVVGMTNHSVCLSFPDHLVAVPFPIPPIFPLLLPVALLHSSLFYCCCCCQLSVVVSCCQLLVHVVTCCHLLSLVVTCCYLLSLVVTCCSLVFHLSFTCCHLLSLVVSLCLTGFPQRRHVGMWLEGVIGRVGAIEVLEFGTSSETVNSTANVAGGT
jgi:hypothetical protein